VYWYATFSLGFQPKPIEPDGGPRGDPDPMGDGVACGTILNTYSTSYSNSFHLSTLEGGEEVTSCAPLSG
jgi:hypothetical protein